MKIKIILVALSIAAISMVVGAQQAGQPLQVAIYPFDAIGIEETAAMSITNAIASALGKSTKIIVRDQVSTRAAIEQIGLAQSGHCAEDKCRVEAGKILKAQKIIMGSIEKLDQNYYTVRMRVVDVQSARTDYQVEKDCPCTSNIQIRDMAVQLARETILVYLETGKTVEIGATTPPAPTPPAPIPTPSQPTQPAKPPAKLSPKPEEITFIAATPEQQKLCQTDMVYVPAGWFMMGCNAAKDSECEQNEYPYHAVYLDAFCIDKYEYPNRQGTSPKMGIDWQVAQGICSSLGKRLPTEAEWEKAARGTDGRTYPWGEGTDNSQARYKTLGPPKPAGYYPLNSSPYGVYDMAGYVWEWVSDWYGENYYSSSPNRNPKGPLEGAKHVHRSGAWNYGSLRYCRTSNRNAHEPAGWFSANGFRCARTL